MTHWFTWALGAVGVEAAFGIISLPSWMRNLRVGVVMLAVAGAIAYILDHDLSGNLHDLIWLSMHPAWGLAFFIIVNWAVWSERKWRLAPRMPLLITGLASIGLISYSLYLIHELILMETWHFYFLGMSDAMTALLITAPLSVRAAWLYFLVCERPFMTRKSGKKISHPSIEEANPASA